VVISPHRRRCEEITFEKEEKKCESRLEKRPQVKSVVASTDLSLSLPTKLAGGLGLKDVPHVTA